MSKITNESPTTFGRLDIGEWFTVQLVPRVYVKIEKSVLDGELANATPIYRGALSSKLISSDTEVVLIEVENDPCRCGEFLAVLEFLLIQKTIEDIVAEIRETAEKVEEKVPGYEQWSNPGFANWMKTAEKIEDEEKDNEGPPLG